MRISKYIFGFDDSYFKFLCSEFRYWGKIFMKSLKKQLWRIHMFFSIIDLTLKKVVFELIPFKIYCHTFFCQRGWTTANKCNICNRFFIDDSDLGTKFDRAFTITFDDIKNTDISYLMNEVKVNRVIFNLYYVVGNFPHCHGENLWWSIFWSCKQFVWIACCVCANLSQGFFQPDETDNGAGDW